MTKYTLLLCLCLFVGHCRSQEPTPEPEIVTTDSMETGTLGTSEPDFAVAGLEKAEVDAFLQTIQEAVAQNDRQKLAGLVAYPLKVEIDGETKTLVGPPEFVAQYSVVMDEQVKQAIAAATVESLFVNWQGVRIGLGEVWFGGVYEGGAEEAIAEPSEQAYIMKIIAINTPSSTS